MTSRERVVAAVGRREPDRIPIDLAGHRSSGIAAMAYARLRHYLGLPPRPLRVYDVIQQLAVVDDDVLERLGVDVVELGRGFALEAEDWKPWMLPDGTPCYIPAWIPLERAADRWVIRMASGDALFHMPDGGSFFQRCHYPFQEREDFGRLADLVTEIPVACPPGPVAGAALVSGAMRLRAATHRAIVGLFEGGFMETGQNLYGPEAFLAMLGAEPRRVHRLLERLTELHLHRLEQFLKAVGNAIDILQFADDLGTQSGPLISTAMYREFFLPRHRALWRQAGKGAGVPVMLHSCGGIRELIPDLISAGVDAINPVQIGCRGMDAGALKRDFGRDLCFWGGGCDNYHSMPERQPGEIARHIRSQAALLSSGGGFVFHPVHHIMADVPPENVVAIYTALSAPPVTG